MKQIFLTLLIFITLSINLFSQDYTASQISSNMKEDASAVIRYDQTDIIIESSGKFNEKRKSVITVLNKNGDNYAVFMEPYDKYSKISVAYAKVMNENGAIIKEIKKTDFKDYSSYSEYTLYSDNRVIYYKPLVNEYPYTVEYEWLVKYSSTMYLPKWIPQSSPDISVEKSVFNISTPKEMAFRFKEFNLTRTAGINYEKDQDTYSWTVENLPAFEAEPYSTNLIEILPAVFIAPNKFELENFSGSMESWEDFGKWIKKLNTEKQNLDDSTVAKLNRQAGSITNKKEIVKTLYEYLQSKTRYVSVQLGIGGFQPVDAATVKKLGYGDCKALSNYMIALLNAVGIKSYYTLIKAGNNKNVIPDFPGLQFNHVIVCVPIEKDTIWLECTNQHNPFGYIGGFTDNRYALVINENGGNLVHTKHYLEKDNSSTSTVLIKVNSDGNADASIKSTSSGLNYYSCADMLTQTKEEQKKSLYNNLNISDFEINDFNLEKTSNDIPTVKGNYNLLLKQFASLSSTRITIPLNYKNYNVEIPEKLKKRKSKIEIQNSYFYSDTITYVLPDSFKVEFKPAVVDLSMPFGDFTTQIKELNYNVVRYIRTLKIYEGKFSPGIYEDFIQFFKYIDISDKNKFVFIHR
ncbi:MAG TPA: DUF3857 domain-containing protein [Bacteroidales bacterium]|nr:DUF3857 domain-containing protein [Bacteroidales bacterium]HPS17576.1 DUF3857 domain-containing protein [Bacteroidales bacterium]